jgi:hypothetical protein
MHEIDDEAESQFDHGDDREDDGGLDDLLDELLPAGFMVEGDF